MKLAILGAGMIVKDFLSMVKDIPEIELKAIIGTKHDTTTMEELSKKYEIKNIYIDFDECLSRSDIDTVYIALPNHLHYSYAKKALEASKNVICEKPFTLHLSETRELKKLALKKDLVLIEAITNQYLENYRLIKNDLKKLGQIKVLECNYSQYSSRYDLFKKGEVLPAFNPKLGGGALMDINIYNIHFVVGLLGAPKNVEYYANIEKNIDTSGVLILNYEDKKAVCIGAKDSTSTIRTTIQGNEGAITIAGPTNIINQYTRQFKTLEMEEVDQKVHPHRMYEEFKEFQRIIATHDMELVKIMLEHSERVMEVVEAALDSASLVLG